MAADNEDSSLTFLDGKVTLLKGDCLERLKELAPDSIDSCVTDPPYHLTSIVKRFANCNPERKRYAAASNSGYMSRGFMGKQWDGGDIAFNPLTWELVFRVLKPGAHLLAFSGTRTYHRMACAIEDAGFEIRDQIGWCYGSGFPKSHDISKAIDRAAGAKREVIGSYRAATQTNNIGTSFNASAADEFGRTEAKITLPATDAAIRWQGWGTALKPAWEPIVLARKPLSESSIAANVLKWGTGAINVDGCRIYTIEDTKRPSGPLTSKGCKGGAWANADARGRRSTEIRGGNPLGRWPANLIHDGSEEVLGRFPESKSATSGYNWESSTAQDTQAARFFYTAKADTDDRLGSKHPTVKPLDLIQYLVRLITPRDGTVLDPFAGTGTTGEASWRENFRAILIEREEEYQTDIIKRMGLCLAGPDERRARSVKQEGLEDTPLFGGIA